MILHTENIRGRLTLNCLRILLFALILPLSIANSFSQEYATVPYSTSFDSGLDKYWVKYVTPVNAVLIINKNVYWNSFTYPDTSTISASLHIKRDPLKSTELSFDYTNRYLSLPLFYEPFDKIYISTDKGKNFFRIFTFYPVNNEKNHVSINLNFWLDYYKSKAEDSLIIKFERKTNQNADFLTIDNVNINYSESPLSFSEVNLPTTVSNLGKLAVADFDNDGDMDIVCGSMDSFDSKFYKNLGNDNFTEISISNTEYILPILQDIDSDGDIDMLYSNRNSSGIFKNLGNYVFKEVPISYKNELWTDGIFCDLDNDGKDELMVTGSTNDNEPVTRLFKNGINGFYEINTVINALDSRSISSEDVDKDNDFDLLFTGKDNSGNSTNAIFVNNRLIFEKKELASFYDYLSSGKFLDINSDGLFDILIAYLNNNSNSYLYLNKGNNKFELLPNAIPGIWNSSIQVADLNNDGLDDIMIEGNDGYWRQFFKIFLNDGNNGFYDTGQLENLNEISDFKIADYDSDNDMDIIMFGKDSLNKVRILKNLIVKQNTKPGIPENLKSKVLGNTVKLNWDKSSDIQTPKEAITYNIRIGSTKNSFDILNPLADSMGFGKLITNGNCSVNNSWELNSLSPGTYFWAVQAIDKGYLRSGFSKVDTFKILPPFTKIDIGVPSLYAYSTVTCGDYDNNGYIDLLFSGRFWDPTGNSPNYISELYSNNGNLNFSKVNTIFTPIDPALFEWMDYNNDNNLDIIATGQGENGINQSFQFTNNGDGSFTSINSTIPKYTWGGLDIGDFTNDGRTDFLINSETGTANEPRTGLYINMGDSKYSLFKSNIVELSRGSNKFIDIDNDYDLDLIVTGVEFNNSPRSVLYENINGNFIISLQNLLGLSYSSISVGDYNNDGFMDIFISGLDSLMKNKSVLYRNSGNGIYLIQNLEIRNYSMGRSYMFDYENDGDVDIVITGKSNKDLTRLYINNENKYFEIDPGINATTSLRDFACSDLDNDGDLDFVVGNKLYINNGNWPNDPPSPPSNLKSESVGYGIKFGWDPSTDPQGGNKGLSYNLRIGTTPGGVEIMSPMSDLKTGYHKIPKLGNVQLNIGWRIDSLPEGKYYWSVQAIDQGFLGGQWAPEQTIILEKVRTDFRADTVCFGKPTHLKDQTIIEGGVIKWKWEFGDGGSSTDQNPQYIYSNPGEYNVTLFVSQNEKVYSRSNKVLVKLSPKLNFKIEDACQGKLSNILNSSDTLTTLINKWLWDFNDGNTSNIKNPNSHGYLNPGTYQVSLSASANNGCETVLQKSVNIYTKPMASVNLKGDPCEGNSLLLETDNNPLYSYRWTFNGYDISGAIGSSIVPKKAGKYSVEITSACGQSVSSYDLVLLKGLPKPEVISRGPNIWYLFCNNDSADIYNWYYNGLIIENAHNHIYVAKQNTGYYQVEIGNFSSECLTKSDTIRIPSIVGIEDADPFTNLKIYPNPTPGLFTIEMDNNVFGKLLIDIFHQNGSKALNIKFEKTTEHFMTQIDLSGQTKGLYIINISMDKYFATRKLVVE